MTQAELMRHIADAVERNPEEWWREFEICFDGEWMDAEPREVTGLAANCPHKVRPKPHTYTLHVEKMPEPLREEPIHNSGYYVINPLSARVFAERWRGEVYEFVWLSRGLCYPDESTAREALEKLTKAMGGKE